MAEVYWQTAVRYDIDEMRREALQHAMELLGARHCRNRSPGAERTRHEGRKGEMVVVAVVVVMGLSKVGCEGGEAVQGANRARNKDRRRRRVGPGCSDWD